MATQLTEELTIRVSEEDLEEWRKDAESAGMGLAPWVRAMCNGKADIVLPVDEPAGKPTELCLMEHVEQHVYVVGEDYRLKVYRELRKDVKAFLSRKRESEAEWERRKREQASGVEDGVEADPNSEKCRELNRKWLARFKQAAGVS